MPGGGAYPAGPANSGLGPGFGPGLGPGLGPGFGPGPGGGVPGSTVPPAPGAPAAAGAIPPPPPLPGGFMCFGSCSKFFYAVFTRGSELHVLVEVF